MLIHSFIVLALGIAQSGWSAPHITDAYSSSGRGSPASQHPSPLSKETYLASGRVSSTPLPDTSAKIPPLSPVKIVDPSAQSVNSPHALRTSPPTTDKVPTPSAGTIVSPSAHPPSTVPAKTSLPVTTPQASPSKDTYSTATKVPPSRSGNIVSPSLHTPSHAPGKVSSPPAVVPPARTVTTPVVPVVPGSAVRGNPVGSSVVPPSPIVKGNPAVPAGIVAPGGQLIGGGSVPSFIGGGAGCSSCLGGYAVDGALGAGLSSNSESFSQSTSEYYVNSGLSGFH